MEEGRRRGRGKEEGEERWEAEGGGLGSEKLVAEVEEESDGRREERRRV